MGSRKGRVALPWVVAVLMVIAVALVGCAEVEVIDATPVVSTPDTTESPLSPESKEHNLAILAVDFDPPLEYRQLLIHQQSVALLVAVENTGDSTEKDVTVRAQLSSPEDPALLLTQGASLANIAPGEIQIVRFGRLGKIPLHYTYHLEVIVDSVVGESDPSDNHKAFDIQIRSE